MEQQAAFYARTDLPIPAELSKPALLQLVDSINSIWDKWGQMSGDNQPLERSVAGPRRDFDINLDGMAHYGMLPDLLQDMRNDGLSAEDLGPLFRSANDYVETWQKCSDQAEARTASAKAG
jgi:hypothetical protein